MSKITSVIPKDDQKEDRNEKKLEDATTEWFGLDDQCKKEVHDALGGRSDDTKQLLDLFSGMTSEVFRTSAECFGASPQVSLKPAPPATAGPIGKASAGVAKQESALSGDFRSMLGLDKAKKAPVTEDQ